MARYKGDPAIARRLRAVCERFGSRSEAARASGVSTDQIGRYLRGTNQPSFEIAARLCRAAGVSLEWLADGSGAMERPEPGEVEAREQAALRHAVETVEALLAEIGRAVPVETRVELILIARDLERETSEAVARRHLARTVRALT